MVDPALLGDDLFTSRLESRELRRETLRGLIATFSSATIRSSAQFCSSIVLARLLLPADFGLLAMVAPIIAFIQVFSDLGLGQAIIQRETIEPSRVSALFWLSLALSCGLTTVVVLLAPATALLYGQHDLIVLTIALGFLVPISALSVCPNALLTRQMRFGTIAKVELLANGAGIGTSITFAWLGAGYWSLVSGQFAAALVHVVLIWRACPWRPSLPAPSQSLMNDLKFGGGLTLANIATLASSTVDNVIVGLSGGPVALGLYDRSYRLAVQPLNQAIAPIGRVSVPLLSRLNGKDEEYRAAYLYIVNTILVASVPGLLVCICSGQAVIATFFGQKWIDAAPIFSWICVGGLAAGVFNSLSWLFVSQGRISEMMRFMLAASTISVLSFAVGTLWGVIGIAAVSAGTFAAITTPLVLYGATRRGPVSLQSVVTGLLPFLCCAVAAYGALTLVLHSVVLIDLTKVTVGLVTCYGTFIAALSAFPSGRSHLKRTYILVDSACERYFRPSRP